MLRHCLIVPLFLSALPAQQLWDGTRIHMPEVPYGASFAAADLDADGDLDVVMVSGGLRPVRLLRNDGHGVFTAFPPSALGSSGLAAAVVKPVDVDGDHDVDLWFAGIGVGNGGPRLWRNTGGGVFVDATATALPAGLSLVNDVAVLDLEGDGDLDAWLAMGTVSPTAQRILRNDGTGQFTLLPGTANQGYAQAGPQAVAVDVDGDGDQDVVTRDVNGYAVARNDGAGSFTMTYASLYEMTSMLIGDIDGDQRPDLLIPSSSRVLRNTGAGVFVPAPQLPHPTSLDVLTDLDGDGDHDLLASHTGYLQNDGTGQFQLVAISAFRRPVFPRNPRALAADFDGDGNLDLLLDWSARAGLLFGNGHGEFVDASPPDLEASVGARWVSFDADGDGDIDLATSSNPVQLLRNDGWGVFTAEALPALPLWPHSLVAGDVDGDGDQDLVVQHNYSLYAAHWITVLTNDGHGQFVAGVAQTPLAGTANAAQMSLIDVDQDGDLDLLVGAPAGTDTTVHLFANDAQGNFTDVSTVAFVGGVPVVRYQVGDVDGDGDPDLIGRYGTLAGGALHLWRNQGGTFTFQPSPLPAHPSAVASLLADLDGDGDLDLVSRGAYPIDQVWIDWNSGTGTFVAGASQFVPLRGTSTVAGDFDGDGDLDLQLGAIPNTYGSLVASAYYENLGGGVFVPGALDAAAHHGDSVDLLTADLDGDGDLDVVGGQPYQPFLHNLDRGLRLRERARPGRPLTFQLLRKPGYLSAPVIGVFVFAGAAAPTPVVIPGVGRTPIDLTMAWVSPLLLLEAPAGAADFGTLLPPVPALIGATFWLHGATLEPEGGVVLTNVWREVVGF